MVQLFVLNSGYGLTTAVAAFDAKLIASAGPRILVSVNAAPLPETAAGPADLPSLRMLVARFDRVERINELLAPMLPTTWSPAPEDGPLLERLLRSAWGIGDDPVELFLQSPQVPPSRTLATLFPGAPITIVGDGLMTYSPIRDRLPRTVVERVRSVIYADVVPDVEPLVFAEAGVARVPVPATALRSTIDLLAQDATDECLEWLATAAEPTAIVLGQYLASLGLVTAAEEDAMQAEMVDRAHDRGARRVVFKPHPSAPPAASDAVRHRATALGLDFELYEGDTSAEVLTARLDPVVVIAGFSSALPTVRTLFESDIVGVGNEMLLHRLSPYENGNRIPVTIVDALTRTDSPYTSPDALQRLVDAVGYCMQPDIMASLRARAVEVLEGLPPSERERYFSERRLTSLRLPGGRRPSLLTRMMTSTGGVGRIEQVRLVVGGAKRRLGRAWKALRGR
jgi:hypothetical protein